MNFKFLIIYYNHNIISGYLKWMGNQNVNQTKKTPQYQGNKNLNLREQLYVTHVSRPYNSSFVYNYKQPG